MGISATSTSTTSTPPDRLITLLDCSTPNRLDLREISVDPKTGALQNDRPIPVLTNRSPLNQQPDDWYAHPAGAGGYMVDLYWREASGDKHELLFVNSSGAAVVLNEGASDWKNSIIDTSGSDGGLVTYSNNIVRQFSGSGDLLCEFALPEFGPERHIDAIAVLGDEIAYVSWRYPYD